MTCPDGITPAAPDAAAELDRFLDAYRPKEVPEAVWLPIARVATSLVRRSGVLTRLRVEKDIQAVGAVVAHLVKRGRPVTLAEVLSDATLLSYDMDLQAAGARTRTRENKRGILRRLQAVDRGLPWREQRRADGERITGLVNHEAVNQLQRLLRIADAAVADDADPDLEAEAFITAVAAARAERVQSGHPDPDDAGWTSARAFGQRHGISLTKRTLRGIVTHELLAQPAPVAVLAAKFHLTRRDLDLALTEVGGLPSVPDAGHHALLRGTPTAVVV